MNESATPADQSSATAEAGARLILDRYEYPVLVYYPGDPVPACYELPEDPASDLAFLRSVLGTDEWSLLRIGRGILLYYAAEPAPEAEENLAGLAVARSTGGGLQTPPQGPVVVTRGDLTHLLAPLALQQLEIVLDAKARAAARGSAPTGRSWGKWV
jgi:hypothetical protein